MDYFVFGDRGIVNLNNIIIEENGTGIEPLRHSILDRCGKLDGGLRLELGQNLFDPPYSIGNLRCFEQDTFFFNFGDFNLRQVDCDSTWVNFLNDVQEVSNIKSINIYPNPSSGKFYFDNIDLPMPFELYRMDGSLVMNGIMQSNELEIAVEGIYFIKFLKDNKDSFRLIRI